MRKLVAVVAGAVILGLAGLVLAEMVRAPALEPPAGVNPGAAMGPGPRGPMVPEGMGPAGQRPAWRQRGREVTGPQRFLARRFVWGRIIEELGLDEEQKAELKKLRTQAEKHAIGLKAKISLAGVDLRTALEQEKVNLDEVRAKLEEIGRLQAEEKFTVIKGLEDVKNILKPEQLEKLKELRKSAMERGLPEGRPGFPHRGPEGFQPGEEPLP